jgi:hypothetical protein
MPDELTPADVFGTRVSDRAAITSISPIKATSTYQTVLFVFTLHPRNALARGFVFYLGDVSPVGHQFTFKNLCLPLV